MSSFYDGGVVVPFDGFVEGQTVLAHVMKVSENYKMDLSLKPSMTNFVNRIRTVTVSVLF